jgi:hypothetical protein
MEARRKLIRWGRYGSLSLIALAVFAVMGTTQATWVTSWYDIVHDWGPCTGYNHYTFQQYSNSNGTYNFSSNGSGYQYDEAGNDALCTNDTTEHEFDAGIHWSPTFDVGVTGQYTVAAQFVGFEAFIYSTTCHGYSHGWFEVGVGVLNKTSAMNDSQIKTADSFSKTCESGYFNFNLTGSRGNVSETVSLSAGVVYQAYAFIDVQEGSEANYAYGAGSDSGAVLWEYGGCVSGGACSSGVTLEALTVP